MHLAIKLLDSHSCGTVRILVWIRRQWIQLLKSAPPFYQLSLVLTCEPARSLTPFITDPSCYFDSPLCRCVTFVPGPLIAEKYTHGFLCTTSAAVVCITLVFSFTMSSPLLPVRL